MPKASERPKLLLLGDSLTQTSFEGWGSGLAQRYQRRADILNRGMSGYNTRWFLQYAKDSGIWEEPGTVKLITIWFGANDASLAKHNPHHHVPIDEYSNNLKRLVISAKETYPTAGLVMITPPPVHHEQRFEYQKQRYGDKATGTLERTLDNAEKYADACKTVASQLDVPCLNMFDLMVKEGGDNCGFGKYLWDGLHFSSEGHDFVLEKLLAFIEKHHPSMSVKIDEVTKQPNNSGTVCTGIPNSGPYHDEIDHENWKKSFGDFQIKTDDSSPPRKKAKTEESTSPTAKK
ncbi:unnamed protein product [Cylindrotheca closterium]|uniref:SGNH hydrolase-type esterase domain-containing protein n=1 Tax=Cylindrotheca closterium TaxID=2856 RepID=A0AAD2JGW0_9STRA|nr:unnamed protein product [Cylindrotheca closterium]